MQTHHIATCVVSVNIRSKLLFDDLQEAVCLLSGNSWSTLLCGYLQEEAQQLHEQKLERILQRPSVQQKDTKSRCSTPDIPTWQSHRRETLARRPDTAYEVEHAGHHNQIPALQRVSCDADTFESTDRADAAGMRSDDMQIARTSSYALSAATLQTEQQLMHHHSKTCHELVHEPVPPNKSKSRSQVQPSPRTRVLAAKAWT